MNCLSCATGVLKNTYLEEELACQQCNVCGGHWLLLEAYMQWKSHYAALSSVVDG